MATIDVVPLQVDTLSSEEAPKEEVLRESEKNESTGSENNENIDEKSRKRGRPAGAKDLKRRKTPVRRKKEISKESLGEIQNKATSSAHVIKDEIAPPTAPAVAPAGAAPVNTAPEEPLVQKEAAARAIARAIPPREELTHYQRLRMQHLERQSAREAHWDGLITPMFRFPVY